MNILCNFLNNSIVLPNFLSFSLSKLNIKVFLKNQFNIGNHAYVLMSCWWVTTVLLRFNDEWFVLKMDHLNDLSLFNGIRIKIHFSLKCSFVYLLQFIIYIFADRVKSWANKKREVSSASSLGFETQLSGKSLISI